MPINITWSLTSGGGAITSVNHAAVESGLTTDETTTFIRHDGTRKITNCALFIGPKTSGYAGDFDGTSDYNELIAWGDSSPAGDFGGFQINMDAEGGFSGGATWGMSELQKTSVDGLKFTVRTGIGDNISNAIPLSEKVSASVSITGEIPAGVTTSSVKTRIKIPTNEDIGGFREFSLFLKYSYTS